MDDLSELDVFYRDTGNALEIIGGLPSSCFYRFPGLLNSFIMATGINSADENWVWIKNEDYSRELLIEVIKMYEKKSLQFMWPVFPDSNIQMESDMDEFGLFARATFNAMIFDSKTDSSHKIHSSELKLLTKMAITSEDASLWADTCWKGFSSEEETPPPEFVRFAQNAVLNDKLILKLGFIENKPVGTYLLCAGSGVYISHFTILSKLRNIGIGSLFMNEIMNYNSSVNNRFLVLLSTQSGRGLYSKFGFRNIADVTIRSFSEDI